MLMNKIFSSKFNLVVISIITISIFFRFINYGDRWGLAYDQAYDAIVARYALESGKLPLLGRFSSAGPFQTGGEWYWIIMLGMGVYPSLLISPWIFITTLYILFVVFLILFSKELVNKRFAVIAGFLTAFSTAQITQSTNLTNQSPLALFSLLGIWASVRYIRKRQPIYLFILGLSVGIGSSIHMQGVALGILLILTMIISKSLHPKLLLSALAGLFIPWIPVFVVDIQNNFVNTRNIFKYYLYDQYKISLDVLGRRWLTYIGVFWPEAWSLITGGFSTFIYIFLPTGLIILVDKINKKKVSKEWATIIATFVFIVCVLRYVRTPLFDSYLVFLHPFVLIISAGFIYILGKKNSIIALFAIFIFLAGSTLRTYKEIKNVSNTTITNVEKLEKILDATYSGKYAIYDYKYQSSSISLPLVLSLYTHHKIDDNGLRVGLISYQEITPFDYQVLEKNLTGVNLINLNKKSHKELIGEGWVFTNPSYVYEETQDWYKK